MWDDFSGIARAIPGVCPGLHSVSISLEIAAGGRAACRQDEDDDTEQRLLHRRLSSANNTHDGLPGHRKRDIAHRDTA